MAPSLRGVRRRGLTQLAVQRIRLEAKLSGLGIETEIDPRADISSRVILHFWGEPGSTIALKIGPNVRIEDGAVLRLKGGCSVELGEGSVVRTGAVLNVSGRLELKGHNLVSWGTVIHSAERVVIGEYTGMSEGVTVVDSTHYRTAPGDDGYLNAIATPVTVGSRTWLASKSVVLPGVTIGDEVTLAALSTAGRDIPAGALAAGSPARVLRERYDGPSPAERQNATAVAPDSLS
ncbi:acyltransferase [Gephyromycinifex aptenodytis]|uniref:acyltransferase n=1 Tax=Gephyromycinifex aptenodytis TaxID=2716227 RepID=UPI00144641B7|nr:DapH/DapD/GlmU-related protein [Gephyromycinifex aptenodytis]